MALLKGTLGNDCVHSVVLSQSFAFIHHPWINRLKARMHLPEILRYLNFRPVMTSDYDLRSGRAARLLDRMLHFYPSEERCTNGVCRRLLLMYGEVVRHDQLDLATHELFYDMFDRANLTALQHLGKMIERGRIVDKDGGDTYVTRKGARSITVPITLIQGMANRLFRPDGARATYDWLIENGRFEPNNRDMFTLVEIPEYGHLDTFIGKRASTAVYPKILRALEIMDRSAREGAPVRPRERV